MSQKQLEVQQLNQDLLEQRAETAALRSSLESKELVRPALQLSSKLRFRSFEMAAQIFIFYFFLQEGSQVSGSMAALQAERDVLQRSVREKDAELSALRSQAHLQQGSLDLERERLNRELEALRAQLQQQVHGHQSDGLQITDDR